ncbi:MAG: hypothetical protein J0J01_06180 [Reyranella sp.]|uniref:hypothetical protein n=1 Tax=Reyranella sp. TaxID=1929291 RepID=UPI001AD2DB62|nr:hypothetical protein [Reyranella sp.]MBN9086478.1 hypothetical protein [Reyranella sp.]
MTEANDSASKGWPLSSLNRPTQDMRLAAHRERGRLLRSLIASAVSTVWSAFAPHRKRRESRPAAVTKHREA